jgi:hypothetical protein
MNDKLTPDQRRAILARLDEAQEERRQAERQSSLPTCVHCWDGSHRVATRECWGAKS